MRVLLIANSHARRGAEPIEPALEVFERAGIEVVQDAVPHGRDAPDAIRRHAGQVDAVVLGGGDGTLHEAAEALVNLGLPVGILPRGTANDLARGLNLPLDLAAAAQVIADGHTRKVDVGEVNGKLFFNVAHIGIGAALSSRLSGGMKKRLGPLAYTLAAARSLAAIRFFRAEIIAGDEQFALRTFGVTVGNGRFFGGSGVVAEDAEIDDGLLHMFALTSKNPIRLLLMLPAITRGTHGRADCVRTLAAPAIAVHTVRPMPVRADGKIVTETPARITVRRAALSIYAPPA